MRIRVDCVPNDLGDPEPIVFHLGARRLDVVRTIDRWPSTTCRYYKVETADGALYILRFDEHRREWELTWYSATG